MSPAAQEKSAAEARRRNALQTSSADRHGGLQRRLQEPEHHGSGFSECSEALIFRSY